VDQNGEGRAAVLLRLERCCELAAAGHRERRATFASRRASRLRRPADEREIHLTSAKAIRARPVPAGGARAGRVGSRRSASRAAAARATAARATAARATAARTRAARARAARTAAAAYGSRRAAGAAVHGANG